MRILAIFDKAYTVDRFTVIVDTPVDPSQPFYDCLGCDDQGGQAFSQWSQAQYTPGGNNIHLGKRVHFEELNQLTQQHLARRVFGAGGEVN